MKAKLRGTEIYYDIAGMQIAPVGKSEFEERPVLFMLHGGPGGDHMRFKQHSLELQHAAQLVFIDHRGCGRSKKTKRSDYTLENNIEDIEALRKHLGLEKISILGYSYGGIVAQGYAIRYPKRVDKLILAVTVPSYHFFDEAVAILHERGTKKQIKTGEVMLHGRFKTPKQAADFFNIMAPLYSTLAMRQKKVATPKPSKLNTPWNIDAFNEGFKNFLRKFNYIPKLKKITAPTLVLGGDKDWICPPNNSKIIAKHIKNAKLKIFKNAGHSIAVDAHKQYIAEIVRFLRKSK